MKYLKFHVTGTGVYRMKGFLKIDDAWKSLTDYYEKTQNTLVNLHLQEIYKIPHVKLVNNDKREKASDLEKLLKTTNRALVSLQSLNRPLQDKLADNLLISIIEAKLDTDSSYFWGHFVARLVDPPTWELFNNFMSRRIIYLRTGKNYYNFDQEIDWND